MNCYSARIKLVDLYFEDPESVIDYLREQSKSKAFAMWGLLSLQKGFTSEILALKHKRPDLKEYLENMKSDSETSLLDSFFENKLKMVMDNSSLTKTTWTRSSKASSYSTTYWFDFE